jgi:hypothetical protein
MKMFPRAIGTLLLAVATVAQSSGPTTVSLPGHQAMAPEIAIAADGPIHLIWIERTPEGDAIAAAGAASIAARAGGVQLAWQQGDMIVTRHLVLADLLPGGQAATAR